jgi:DNA excision repair protein ERCC-4
MDTDTIREYQYHKFRTADKTLTEKDMQALKEVRTDMQKDNDFVHIVADDRERKSDVIESLLEIEDVAVDIKRLSIGDYQINNRVIVERKTLKDFAISIIDGRLFNQMVRLANSKFQGVLILEGTAGDSVDIGVTREAMQGALITVSLIMGIPVLRSRNPPEAAKLIIFIARQVESIAGRGVQRHGHQPKGLRYRQRYILQGLPKVGRERADRLLDRFGSVEAVISAGIDDLQTVDGIGKNIAEKIKWAVSERVPPSSNKSFDSEPSSVEPASIEVLPSIADISQEHRYESA